MPEPKMVPLGDQAVLITLESELKAHQFATVAKEQNPEWLVDVVQAYVTVAIFFDLHQARFAEVVPRLRAWLRSASEQPLTSGTLHKIPCCYEMGEDLARVAEIKGLTTEQVIEAHLSVVYVVYAIGFCPGFPYLGYLPSTLENVPRLESPRTRVESGSVGLTGRQTGIYTEPRPGGWNLIGRTPRKLVDVRTGDRAQFVRINEQEFHLHRQGAEQTLSTTGCSSSCM